jgi:hypothetical protein
MCGSSAVPKTRNQFAIFEKWDDEITAARTYNPLGIIAAEQGDFAQAGQWLARSIVIFLRYDDRDSFQRTAQNFLRCYALAPQAVQATLKTLWEGAVRGSSPAENARE